LLEPGFWTWGISEKGLHVKSLSEQVSAYEAYHHDARNKLTHFVGVPLVTFSIFLFLGWLRFVHEPSLPFTGAALFYVIVFIYYLVLDWKVALLQAPFTLSLLWLADRIAIWPFAESATAFLIAFIGGWIIQLVGHAFEGKRPALADNILQIFNAPLFLTVEVMHAVSGPGAGNIAPESAAGKS
jgi:uncharacterized membrane protein YGL010W